jgi:hypothetical protein
MRQYVARAADRDGQSKRGLWLGTVLLLAWIAILSANGGDIGCLLCGIPIGAAFMLMPAASRTSSSLASCTVVDQRRSGFVRGAWSVTMAATASERDFAGPTALPEVAPGDAPAPCGAAAEPRYGL